MEISGFDLFLTIIGVLNIIGFIACLLVFGIGI